MRAVLLVSHGSWSLKTIEEVSVLVRRLKEKTGISIFEFAFLEVASPTIPQGIDICISKGATHVLVLLNFLNAGRHINDDIPLIIEGAKIKYPNVHFTLSQPIGQHPKITDLFIDLIKHA